MGVITWRNVEAPDLRGAASMLQLASNGINSGFDKFNQVLQNEQATADANWKVQRDNNTQAFLDSINQYRTPEEYQAALTSGALDPAKFGAQIDQAAARSALDGRLAILQDRAVKAGQFEDQQKAREAKPIVDRLSMMALSDDKDVRASAKAALTPYMEAGMLPNGAELAGKIRTIDHENDTWARDTIKFDREGKKLESDLKTDSARRGWMAAQAENLRDENSGAKAALKAELAAVKRQNEAAALKIKNSPLDAGTMDTYEGKIKFLDGLKKLNIPQDQAENAYQELSRQFGNGVRVGVDAEGKDVRIGLPVSTALAAVEAAGPDAALRPNWLVGSGRGSRAVDRVGKLMNEPTYVGSLQEAMQAQGIQYRPLTAKASDTEAPATARSALPKPTNARLFAGGDPGVDPLDASGAAVMNQVIQARAEKAKSMMTPAEIEESQKTGKLPFRIKRLLESQNER